MCWYSSLKLALGVTEEISGKKAGIISAAFCARRMGQGRENLFLNTELIPQTWVSVDYLCDCILSTLLYRARVISTYCTVKNVSVCRSWRITLTSNLIYKQWLIAEASDISISMKPTIMVTLTFTR